MKRFINLTWLFILFISFISCDKNNEPAINDNSEGFKYLLENGQLTLVSVPDNVEIRIPHEASYNGKTYPVTAIGLYAFNDKPTKFLHIPNSITKIGTFAFKNTTIIQLYLEDIESWCNMTFSVEGLTEYENQRYSNPINSDTELFIDNEKVETLTIPSSVKTIQPFLFKYLNFEKLIIEDGVESIGQEAFSNCYNLSSVEFGNTINEIGYSAFNKCFKLNSIILPDSLINMRASVFANTRLENVYVSSLENWTKISLGYSSLSERLLNLPFTSPFNLYVNNEELTVLEIPENIKQLKPYAFAFVNLKEIRSFGNLSTIAPYAFSNCTQLSELITPSNISEISSFSFQNCKSLKSIACDEGLNLISENAFANCVALEQIELPHSLKTLGEYVFEGCNSLRNVALPEGLEYLYPAFFSNENLESIYIPSTLRFLDNSFFECDNLRSIEINCEELPAIPYEDFEFYAPLYQNCVLYVPKDKIDLYKNDSLWGKFKNIIGKDF